jgi:hypothetical protein
VWLYNKTGFHSTKHLNEEFLSKEAKSYVVYKLP